MSRRRVPGPRFGATPVRIHAGRFWYISATRAVDRVDEQSPPAVLVSRAVRKRQALGWQTLRHEAQRLVARDLGEPVDERGLAHTIDGVDGVAFVVMGDAGERIAMLRGERVEHRGANAIVQREDRRKQTARDRPFDCSVR